MIAYPGGNESGNTNMHLITNLPVYILLFLTLYFEVFLVLTFIEDRADFRKISAVLRKPEQYPGVTIIVPAWNEGETLRGTIHSLLALDFPTDKLNIFIVDDGSTDNTLSVANEFSQNPQIRIFHKANGGKYTALNLGLKECTTPLVGCLDADSFVDTHALKEIVPYFDNNEVMAVTPSVQIHRPDNMLRRMQSTEYMIGEFTRKIFSRINGLYVTPGPFSIYRRSVFDQIGDFVHGYNTEDMEMALRMQSHGMKIDNAHMALVYTVSPATLRALYNQRVRWVTGFLKNSFFTYRHMFFTRKYGNLGMLTMPFAFMSIFIALFFTAMYYRELYGMLFDKYLEYSAVGFHLALRWPHYDWFSLDLGFQTLIIYLLFSSTLFFVFIGVKMVKKRVLLSRDMLYFLILYGLIAPFWLARSLYNLVTTKSARWR